MDAEMGKVFQLDWLAKFLFFVFGAMLFLAPACLLYDLCFDNSLPEQTFFSYILMVLILLVLMAVGFMTLLSVAEKITVTSSAVVQSNLIKINIIPLNSILVVKYLWIPGGKGGSEWLFIKTEQASFKMGLNFTKKRIDEAVTYILEKIHANYPENYTSMMRKMEEDTKQKESVAVANFWRE
ncbi:MAG: hypothetical protein NVS3B3_16160 [Aquirhabdus sp.]